MCVCVWWWCIVWQLLKEPLEKDDGDEEGVLLDPEAYKCIPLQIPYLTPAANTSLPINTRLVRELLPGEIAQSAKGKSKGKGKGKRPGGCVLSALPSAVVDLLGGAGIIAKQTRDLEAASSEEVAATNGGDKAKAKGQKKDKDANPSHLLK